MNTAELTRKILWLIQQAETDIQAPETPKSDFFSSLRLAMLKNDIRDSLPYEYRQLSDFVEGDTLYLYRDIEITEVKRASGYVALCWEYQGMPQAYTGREDDTCLALKREEK